jgi:dihydropyrimidine dehydrogenase (NAD+) subunit PreT
MNGLAELLPPLSDHEAIVEASRCLYCFDAPCAHACPTHIDIPRFITRIGTGNLTGSAHTILESNLLGATCARVCPVEELCEGACVLNAEESPVRIGRLQRYAMDYVYRGGIEVFPPVPRRAHSVAVIGAGPAGLSCAGELARRGCSVTVFERRPLAGGLSTYGIIGLREPVTVALEEVDMIARLGVSFERGVDVGHDLAIASIQSRFNAIFLATGLGGTASLGIPGEEHITDGLAYIEQSKLGLTSISTGRRVIVIGAGNTAIDCATVAKRTGAERVTMVYRRTEREMTAYPHEYEFVKKEGVAFEFLAQPAAALSKDGVIVGLECVRMSLAEPDASGRPNSQPLAGSKFVIPADQVIKAIGQWKSSLVFQLGLETERGFIKVDRSMQTSRPGIYAGGDCIRAKGAASTVMAVQDGKTAAAAIEQQIAHTQVFAEVANG